MSTKKTNGAAADTEILAEQIVQEKQTEATPRVYCGPTVRAVAHKFTVYSGELPEELKTFTRKHPAARGLIVPIEKFAEVRRRIETSGTAENILFNKIKSEL